MTEEELTRRQSTLQVEAEELLSELNFVELLADVGPVLLAGSFVSGLMTWRELDVMVLAGPDFTPDNVLALMRRLVGIAGVTGLEYQDERGDRCPTEHRWDERYHVGVTLERPTGTWHIDLSIWLHDPHANVAAWHQELRTSVTSDQRAAILSIKDIQCRLSSYEGGMPIYQAVLECGVRTPEQFAVWLQLEGRQLD